MATNETPATGDRYWRVYGGPFVWWFGDNAGAGRVCESLRGGESKAACAESDFDLANEHDIKLTHAEARAILGDKWPATWPQQGEGTAESTATPATGQTVAGVLGSVPSPATGQGGHTGEAQYLVYSRACQMWWAPGGAGYRLTEAEAGRFDKHKAEEYSRFPAWRAGQTPDGGPSEFMYLAPECATANAATIRELREKYHELLYAVGNAYPGETRHQTALRYIVEREACAGQTGESKQDTAEIRRVRGEVKG